MVPTVASRTMRRCSPVRAAGRFAVATSGALSARAAAVAAVGAPGLHFHDLRHSGNTLAGEGGASLRDLMERMGHDSVRAAMMYQHPTTEASRRIADSISDMIQRAEDVDDSDEPNG